MASFSQNLRRVFIHGKDEVDAFFSALDFDNPPVSNIEILFLDLK